MSDSVESLYDARSENYDEDHAARTAGEITAVEEIVVKSLLRCLHYDDVFDAATGTGRYALFLAGQGKRVEAADQNAKMLSVAQRKAENRGLTIGFKRESVSNCSAGDASFDLVLCMLALAHVEDLHAPLKEFVRVLRPGGHLLISDIHPDIQRAWGPQNKALIDGKEFPFPAYHASIDEYVNAAVAAGAEVVVSIDVPMQQQRGLFPGPFVMLARKPSPPKGPDQGVQATR